MPKQGELDNAIARLKRNYYYGIRSCNPCCVESCDNSAIGIGPCADCSEDELAKVINSPGLARSYHRNLRENAKLMAKMNAAMERR